MNSVTSVVLPEPASPVTKQTGTPQNPFTDWYDAFVARLDPDGTLIWNTFLGGAGSDYGNSIAVDGSGAVVITGTSDETWGTEPRRAFSGYEDAFVARLDTNGSFVWNTFLGGVSSDQGWGIALDPKGVVYVTGISFSTWGTPLRPFAGYQDVLVARLDEAGNLVEYLPWWRRG